MDLRALAYHIVIGYIFGLAVTLWFANKKYGFNYARSTTKAFIINICLIVIVFVLTYNLEGLFRYFAGAGMLAISVSYSLIQLDKRIGLKAVINDSIKVAFKKFLC
jgi:ABC-type amino acid transport system permease subunit